MTDAEDDPFAGVEDGLLETDISEKSYNKAPWRSSNNSSARATNKLILHNAEENQDPLVGLSIADSSGLLEAVRSSCDSCGASRRYFCYGCRRSLSSTARFIPRVLKLPLKVDVVKHGGELDGKSTAIHAAVICPEDVRIFTYPDLPELDNGGTVLVYPSDEATYVSELDESAVRRVLFVDATWSQAKQIIGDERLSKTPRVTLKGRKTAFWRNQKGKTDKHLATIEAIYYFTRDFHCKVLRREYNHEYDNLLFLFKFFRDKLQTTYKS